MTLRTKSKARQWTVWLCASLALLVVYAVLSRVLNDSGGADILSPRQHRLLVPLLVLLFHVVRETRWDGVKRTHERGGRSRGKPPQEKKVGTAVHKERAHEVAAGEGRRASSPPRTAARPVPLPVAAAPAPRDYSYASSFSDDATGEALFIRTRNMLHQEIPDYMTDGLYLDILGDAAEKGYAPAMVKLGEYAMRRATWVEAYYWMSLAKRSGMQNLANVMLEIRRNWSLDGFSDEAENVNPLFSTEAGSIGRALLHLDSGHDAAAAREFLMCHHPDFLAGEVGGGG